MSTDNVVSKDFVNGRNARISVTFNKLVRTQEYESERVEASLEFDLVDGENAELALLQAQIQLEYAIYVELLAKRQISQEDFDLHKRECDDALAMMSEKLRSLGVQIAE